MIANLNYYIQKSGLSSIEFGKKAFPDMPFKTEMECQQIRNKVTFYKTRAKSINLELLERFSEILEVDYNQLLGYENKS